MPVWISILLFLLSFHQSEGCSCAYPGPTEKGLLCDADFIIKTRVHSVLRASQDKDDFNYFFRIQRPKAYFQGRVYGSKLNIALCSAYTERLPLSSDTRKLLFQFRENKLDCSTGVSAGYAPLRRSPGVVLKTELDCILDRCN